MGLIGIIVASVLNLFLHSSQVRDQSRSRPRPVHGADRLRRPAHPEGRPRGSRLGSVEKAAVVGALRLYLDFVNLFLFMLRLLGSR